MLEVALGFIHANELLAKQHLVGVPIKVGWFKVSVGKLEGSDRQTPIDLRPVRRESFLHHPSSVPSGSRGHFLNDIRTISTQATKEVPPPYRALYPMLFFSGYIYSTCYQWYGDISRFSGEMPRTRLVLFWCNPSRSWCNLRYLVYTTNPVYLSLHTCHRSITQPS